MLFLLLPLSTEAFFPLKAKVSHLRTQNIVQIGKSINFNSLNLGTNATIQETF
jgi:hypothetical protein